MTQETIDQIQEQAEDFGLDFGDNNENDIRPLGDYSGRGMFGTMTLALRVTGHALEQLKNSTFQFRSDNLGKDYVIY